MVTSAALDLLNSAKDVISAKETPEQDHRCTELQLSCQEFEKLYEEELMPWLLQQDVEDNIEMNSPRSRDLNSSGTNEDLSDSLYDSLESASKKSRKKRSSRWISEEENLKKMEEKVTIWFSRANYILISSFMLF